VVAEAGSAAGVSAEAAAGVAAAAGERGFTTAVPGQCSGVAEPQEALMNAEQHPGDVTDETVAFEDADARTRGHADRPPTPDEEQAAETNVSDEAVAEHYREAIERGAKVKGEGQIEP
jgi:hypothetical protein